MRSAATLVGRSSESTWLLTRLEDAFAGRPQLVLVTGEPGAGKSRLVRELLRDARERGADVCTGRCREHLALPYLAFVDGLLPRLERFAADDPELSGYAHLISRLLGRAPDPVTTLELTAPSPEQEQTWLFMAVARAVVRLAQHRPVIVAIDDLQWADRPSVDLLTHVVLQVADTALLEAVPLLVVATMRPELDARLTADVERLEREDLTYRLELQGLDETGSAELIEALGYARPSRRLIDAVYEATGGNPLLVEHVVDQLDRPGALVDHGGELVPTVSVAVPDELSDAVRDRIEHVSPACRHTLVAASFLSDSFTTSDVAALVGDDVAIRLDEAVAAGLLNSLPDGQFRFPHPIYVRVVGELADDVERRRLHLAVANRLDRLDGDERDVHLLELARHLVGAGSTVPAARVFDINLAAAERAWTMFAWSEAAQAFEAAATAAIEMQQAGAVVADLEYRAGRSRYRALETGPSRMLLERAASRFRADGDQRGLALALAEIARADLHHLPGFGAVVDIRELEEVLAALRQDDPALCGRLMAQVSDMYWIRGDLDAGDAFARQALELGQASDDAATCTQAQVALAVIGWLRLDLRDAAAHLAQARDDAAATGDPWLWGHVLPREALTRLWLGELEAAETIATRGVARTNEVGDQSEASLALAALVGVAAARGDATAADRWAAEAWNAARIARYDWGASFFLPTVAGARVYTGADHRAENALDQWNRVGWSDQSMYDDALWLTRRWVRAHAGHVAEVRADLERRPGIAEARWWLGIGAIARYATLVELAELTGVEIARDRVERALAAAADAGQVLTEGPLLLVARVRGVLARLDGRLDDSVTLLRRALEEATRLGLGPERARSALDLARTLRERDAPGDAARAASFALDAQRSFEAAAMPRFAALARFLASPAHLGIARDATAVILFTDVADSTRLTERWGDDAYRQRANALERALRTVISDTGGRVVEGITLGDGLLAVFSLVDGALECARGVHQQANAVGLSLHVGLHAGTVREEGGGVYGGAVNLAARVCSVAAPGETLISDAVRAIAAPSEVAAFEDRGLHELKGIAQPQRLYAVVTEI